MVGPKLQLTCRYRKSSSLSYCHQAYYILTLALQEGIRCHSLQKGYERGIFHIYSPLRKRRNHYNQTVK